MNTFRLSKSTYCDATQCNKILWLDKYKSNVAEEADNEDRIETGQEVGELAKKLFGEGKDISYDLGLAQMIIKTEEYIEEGTEIITEASFAYKNCFCSVDILKNNHGKLEIYEVKSGTKETDRYVNDIAYQYYVLRNLGYIIDSANLVYINNKYIRKGELELDKLFTIDDITTTVMEKQPEVKEKIEEINEYMKQRDEPILDINPACGKPNDCRYWKYCSKCLPPNNVFEVSGMHLGPKYEFYCNSIVTFSDLSVCPINPKYLEQIDFELNNREPKIEKEEIKAFLNNLYYPLYFLDFESYQQVIPLWDGVKPYLQVPFQYSLHYIEEEGGEIKHREFLAEAPEIDAREQIAKRLIEDIPANACVLAYNMAFEKEHIIKKLATSYKHLEKDLMKIYDNIQDLIEPFKKRQYYVKEMKGRSTIKLVLPALFPDDPELDYHNLSGVHHGGEAMSAFRSISKKTKEDQARIRRELLEYCKLDTYAMVKLWQKLHEVCDE